MKAIKRLLSVAVCLMMALSLMTVVKAADATCTITAPDNNHVYYIYQIFTGDVSDGTLSNIKWGKNGTGTESAKVDDETLAALTAVTASTNDDEKLDVIEKYANIGTWDNPATPYAQVTAKGEANVPGGYYLIVDRGPLADDKDTYSVNMVEVVGSFTIEPKTTTTPGFEKKVKDTNDTTGETTGWQDSADYDVGDEIPFQLKATINSDYAKYNTYYLNFHDVEEEGLTFNANSVKVYVDSVELKSGWTLKTTGLNDDCTFEVEIADCKSIDAIKAGSVVTVEYTSTLNENAVIGDRGNINTGSLEFTNNPNNNQGGKPTGRTPDDKVIVFTYRVDVNKITKDKTPLKDATFTLYKKVDNDWVKVADMPTAAIKADDDSVVSYTSSFLRVDDGDYKLVETVTPPGYNTMEDILFTITATHDAVSDLAKLTALDGGNLGTGVVSTGAITKDIINEKGSTLPTTGGMGTTMIYVGGASLMAVAAILLVSKKRMATK